MYEIVTGYNIFKCIGLSVNFKIKACFLFLPNEFAKIKTELNVDELLWHHLNRYYLTLCYALAIHLILNIIITYPLFKKICLINSRKNVFIKY